MATTAAFGESLIAELPALRAYALVVTRSANQADDLVQDSLERAWKFQHSYKPGTRLRAWLFTILRNAHFDSVRRNRRHIEDADGERAAQLVVEPEQHWRVECADILDGLKTLSGESRHALLLVLGLGLTYEEASVACGCPVTTVKSRVSRARLRLLAIFGERQRSLGLNPRPRKPNRRD